MNSYDKRPWYDVYRELANVLYDFYKLHEVHAGKKLFYKCMSSENSDYFIQLNPWSEKFKDKWHISSFDPIHIFASFNYYNIAPEKRIELINFYFKILDSNTIIYQKEVDFNGIPSPIIETIVSARKEEQQIEIWKFFYYIIDNKERSNYDFLIDFDIFKRVRKWYGIAIPSITMFMFWIDSRQYISLDNATKTYLVKHTLEVPTTTIDYIRLLNEIKSQYQSFREIVQISTIKTKAWHDEELYYDRQYKDSQKEIGLLQHNLHLIAIKPLNSSNSSLYNKTLKEDIYYFNNLYNIKDKKILYDYENDHSMYDVKADVDLKINISAIVGKNGTGKSTIVELLIIGVNNIAKILNSDLDIDFIQDTENSKIIYPDLELYIFIDKLYKFTIIKNDLIINEYKFNVDNEYELNPKNIIDSFNLSDIFYNILLNYSLHGLNERDYGKWLHKLFHKNDAYQTPIVLEPFREDGNFNINRQLELVKSRLLTNLLEKCNNKMDVVKYRKLTEFQYAEKLEISIDKNKLEYISIISKNENKKLIFTDFGEEYIEYILNKLFEEFKFKNMHLSVDVNSPYKSIDNIAKLYLFKKIVLITIKHKHYHMYLYNTQVKFIEACVHKVSLFEKIYKDKSHLTYKIRQVVNFLAYKDEYEILHNHTLLLDTSEETLENVADEIHRIDLNHSINNLVEMMPPSFFKINILMNDGNSFNTLSSGEKQKIYIINSILYHLKNISSVSSNENDIVKYKSINIILDEIELYFHPQMQKKFINDLLENIKTIKYKSLLDDIDSLNFLFVTHSPFILSDIPSMNLMLLDKEEGKKTYYKNNNDLKSFGANIHELLANSFFLEDGTIGKFSLLKIQEILQFHEDVLNVKKTKADYINVKKHFRFIQNSIGEEYIKGIVENHIEEIEKSLGLNIDNDLINKIDELEKELELYKIKLKDNLEND